MGSKKRILLIEDEENTAALIKAHADIAGYKLHVEVDGVNGFQAIERDRPDLILLDVMLPGMNGLDVCRKVKNSSEIKGIPVIFLSAKAEELDIVLGLELGADDYVVKPFSARVLFARIKAVLRRGGEGKKGVKTLSFGDFILELDRYILRRGEEVINVTLSEFGILRRLLINQGKALTRNQLLDEVNNDEAYIVDRNIDVHVASLRKKLGAKESWIETVRGVGYRFRD